MKDINKIINYIKRTAKKAPAVLPVINILILILFIAWAYMFIHEHFTQTKKDAAFIKDNISNISYSELKIEQFDEVYKIYQDKINYHLEMPTDLISPFNNSDN